jgi:hypothetical protein
METEENKGQPEKTILAGYRWEIPISSLADPEHIDGLYITLPDGRTAPFRRWGAWI